MQRSVGSTSDRGSVVGVPNLPKCRVTVSSSYRKRYHRVRQGIEAVPNRPEDLGTALPSGYLRYTLVRTQSNQPLFVLLLIHH